jgi:hypothetical protein
MQFLRFLIVLILPRHAGEFVNFQNKNPQKNNFLEVIVSLFFARQNLNFLTFGHGFFTTVPL